MRRFLAVSALCALYVTGAHGACDIGSALRDAEVQLRKVTPVVSGKRVYHHSVRLPDGTVRVNKDKLLIGYAKREVPIAILNQRTCVVRVERPWHEVRDGILTDPQGVPGLKLEAEPLAWWNWRNTAFAPADPDDVVVGELWKPYGKKAGFYVPHSMRLQRLFPEVVVGGVRDSDSAFERAERFFLAKGIYDEATVVRLSWRMRLCFRSEHTDPDSFRHAGPELQQELAFKVDVQMFLNPGKGLTGRTSSAGAVGLAQVIPDTCVSVRARQPRAKFNRDCSGAEGLDSQAASLAAGMVVLEEKEEQLAAVYGDKVYGSWGDVPVGVAYHSGAPIVKKALQAHGPDWIAVHTEVVRVGKGKKAKKVRVRRKDSLGPQGVLYARKLQYLIKFELRETGSFVVGGATR